MDINKLLTNGYLCNDYEESFQMNSIKYELISNLTEKFSDIYEKMQELLKKKSENKIMQNKISTLKGDNFNQLFVSLNQTIEYIFSVNLKMINKILVELNKLKESFQPYFDQYKNFVEIEKNFLTKLKEFETTQNNFYEATKKAEMFTYEFLKKKVYNLKPEENAYKNKENMKNQAKIELEKYKAKLSEINVSLKQFNTNQKQMFIIEKEFDRRYNNFYYDCLMIYFEHQEILNSTTQNVKNKIISINADKTEKEKELKNYLENYREKEEIQYKNYQTNINFENCENNIDLNICFMTFGEIENLIGSYNDADITYETQKFELTKLLDKLFELDTNISDSDIQKIKDILKDEKNQNIYINYLNNYRARGKYLKSEKFIILNGLALNAILETAEKQKNFQTAKLCIILSQTFYFIEPNENKFYLVSLIKNNKWLKSGNFWRNFIELSIQKGLSKIQNNSKKNLNDALFALLFPYISEMQDFEIDKRIMVKLFDEILEKYDYLNKENYEMIFSSIDKDKNMIEKYRKEYKDNPNLENEL